MLLLRRRRRRRAACSRHTQTSITQRRVVAPAAVTCITATIASTAGADKACHAVQRQRHAALATAVATTHARANARARGQQHAGATGLPSVYVWPSVYVLPSVIPRWPPLKGSIIGD